MRGKDIMLTRNQLKNIPEFGEVAAIVVSSHIEALDVIEKLYRRLTTMEEERARGERAQSARRKRGERQRCFSVGDRVSIIDDDGGTMHGTVVETDKFCPAEQYRSPACAVLWDGSSVAIWSHEFHLSREKRTYQLTSGRCGGCRGGNRPRVRSKTC
jgi:hypothetical protein